jgi:hypothetical protein
MVFSVVFFAGPLVRMAGVGLENRRRRSRNIRRVLLGLVYRRSLEEGPPIGAQEARAFVASQLEGEAVSEKDVTNVLDALAAELDAEVSVADDGVVRYAFPAIRTQYEASEKVRAVLRLEDRTLGEIVFDTGDTSQQESDRAGAAFDRALADPTEHGLDRFLPTVDRVSYQDDFELVAFDEELKRSTDDGGGRRR